MLDFKELLKRSDMKDWKDISHELCRAYRFSDGDYVTIQEPIGLIVSKNGHRIVDANEVCHYVPNGWIHMFWDVVESGVLFKF